MNSANMLKLALAALAIAGALAAASADSVRPGVKPKAQPAAAQPPGDTAAVARVGNPDSARWTATTYEAAATEANKKVLASGKKATVTGEVVDVSCYLQLGKRGEAHVACGTKCIAHGEPIGIVDEGGELYILFAEQHHPRRDGQVDLRATFLPLLAKTVTVTGMHTDLKGYHALFVQAEPVKETGGER